MMVRHILFLDFDGVLMIRRGKRYNEPSPVAFANLRMLLEAVPTLQIVICSSWRQRYPLDQLRTLLAGLGIDRSRVVDVTPNHADNNRSDEIMAWLEANEWQGWVVFDDGILNLEDGAQVRPYFRTGLLAAHCYAAMHRLGMVNTEVYP